MCYIILECMEDEVFPLIRNDTCTLIKFSSMSVAESFSNEAVDLPFKIVQFI